MQLLAMVALVAVRVVLVAFKAVIWPLMKLYSVSAEGLPALLWLVAIVSVSVILGLIVLGLVLGIILSQDHFLM